MKNLKIQLISLSCILILTVLSGCGGSGGSGDSGGSGGNGGDNPPSDPTALVWQSLDPSSLAGYPAQGLSEIVVNLGIPYIACRNSTDVWLLKYDGRWNNLYGGTVNNTTQPMEGSPSLAFYNNQPYLACKGTAYGAQGIGFWEYSTNKLSVISMLNGTSAVEPCLSRNGSNWYILSRNSSTNYPTVTARVNSNNYGLSDCNETCAAADLEVFNDYPYIALKTPTDALTVKKYSSNDGQSGSWDPVGSSSVATTIVDFAFDIDSTGTVYTIFTNASGLAVKKYTTGWETVGPAEYLFEGNADNVTIFINGTTPYIAYRDVTNDQIKVRKFTNNAWLELGSFTSEAEGESLPGQLNLSLYIDGNVVYAAYMNSGGGVTVKKGQ